MRLLRHYKFALFVSITTILLASLFLPEPEKTHRNLREDQYELLYRLYLLPQYSKLGEENFIKLVLGDALSEEEVDAIIDKELESIPTLEKMKTLEQTKSKPAGYDDEFLIEWNNLVRADIKSAAEKVVPRQDWFRVFLFLFTYGVAGFIGGLTISCLIASLWKFLLLRIREFSLAVRGRDLEN